MLGRRRGGKINQNSRLSTCIHIHFHSAGLQQYYYHLSVACAVFRLLATYVIVSRLRAFRTVRRSIEISEKLAREYDCRYTVILSYFVIIYTRFCDP